MNLGTNIRIGNDIRLHVTIRKEWDENNIKQIRAYIINTSLRDEEQNPWNHVMRFPRDPQSKFFRPGPHHLNRCGAPCYHCHHHDPNYVFDDGFHRPFWSCMDPHFYHGFGLEPGRFPYRWFGWTRRHDPGFGHRSPFDTIEMHLDADFEYLAPAKVVDGKNKIVVYFPAQDQLACGAYKLVLVVTTYEAGWGRDNLHTYTVDYGNLFNLVDDQSGVEGDVVYDADQHTIINRDISDLVPAFGHYYIMEGTTLKLGDKDAKGNQYRISGRVNGGDWATFKYDWRYDDVLFDSSDHNLVDVNETTGELFAANYKDGDHDAIIKFQTVGGEVTGKFIITVVEHIHSIGEMGATFSTSTNPNQMDPASFVDEKSEFGITNPGDSYKYLWIRTVRPIQFTGSGNTITVTGVTSGGYMVPMQNYIQNDDYYYYRSIGKMIPGDHTFKVELSNG